MNSFENDNSSLELLMDGPDYDSKHHSIHIVCYTLFSTGTNSDKNSVIGSVFQALF